MRVEISRRASLRGKMRIMRLLRKEVLPPRGIDPCASSSAVARALVIVAACLAVVDVLLRCMGPWP